MRVVGQVFPWDLADDPGRAETLRASGVDDVAVALNYHATRAVQWLPSGEPSVRIQRSSMTFLRPDPSAWDGGLEPRYGTEDDAISVESTIKIAKAAGLGVRGWLLVTHDDDAGLRHPDFVAVDAWGNRSAYAICNSHQQVARTARTLVEQAVKQTGIHQMFVESLGTLGFDHGLAHDKSQHSSFTAADVLFLSVCFCEACFVFAGNEGFSLDEVRHNVRAQFRQVCVDEAKDTVADVMSMRASANERTANALSFDRRVEITIGATGFHEQPSSFATIRAHSEALHGLCATLNSESQLGWSDVERWSQIESVALAGVFSLAANGQSLQQQLEASGSLGREKLLTDLYLYHVGMRHPDTLASLRIHSQ